ncbi:MAG: MBL fold metallo-hydrolase [Verrucomicrobia bacterium]|nr:MBL fold metallo-hydrolase [Verrucomicrobiota bacterium]
MKTSNLTRREFACVAAIGAAGIGSALAAKAAAPASRLKITIIGDSSCIPDVRREMACFLINGKHLVDTGWCAALKMREYGFDPLALESIILTHFHQDHYIGLPQLLFYIGLRKRPGPPLNIVGPSENLQRVVEAADAFLQVPRFPELAVNRKLVPLTAGDKFETPDLRFETFAANHVSGTNRVEQALVYKVTDKASGACAVFTGDTHHHPPIAEFAKGASLLIHDGAHTAPKDAARIAQQAGVSRLVLIHYAHSRAAKILAEAKAVFPNTELAEEGRTLEVACP